MAARRPRWRGTPSWPRSSTGWRRRVDTDQPVRAGFIKIAIPADPAELPTALWEAAAAASRDTGAALLAHTEAGAAAEQIVTRLLGYGAAADRLVICHIDKRPDFGLHRELAQAGVLLEYDTFFRPKYDPERNVWPLLQRMVAAGLAGQVAIGTDLAGTAFWQEIGPAALPGEIVSRLRTLGFEPSTIRRLTGGNADGWLSSQSVERWSRGFSRSHWS